ncbi:hypothetical protein PUN28_020205 [Cardiocondyla obscurior]|uniref:Ribosomal protein L20 n=1 Tax=Cardiocondyla obscurior TaxID=286306 RepID=A0AAW2E5P1_9HYME
MSETIPALPYSYKRKFNHDISVRSYVKKKKIKTLLLYKSTLIYTMDLFKKRLVQQLLRFGHVWISQYFVSRIRGTVVRCIYTWREALSCLLISDNNIETIKQINKKFSYITIFNTFRNTKGPVYNRNNLNSVALQYGRSFNERGLRLNSIGI